MAGHTGPNFERVRRALLLQGEPDRVPLAELEISRDIKTAFLGRPVQGLGAEVEFWVEAGYDFAPLAMGLVTGLTSGAGVRLHPWPGTSCEQPGPSIVC